MTQARASPNPLSRTGEMFAVLSDILLVALVWGWRLRVDVA